MPSYQRCDTVYWETLRTREDGSLEVVDSYYSTPELGRRIRAARESGGVK